MMSSDGYINVGLSIPPTILTIIGSTVFIITLLKTSSLHTPSNVLLGALCITDLLAGALCQPIHMALRLYKAGKNFSKLSSAYNFIFHLSCLNSFGFSLLITLDRYVAILYPFTYREHFKSKKYAYLAFGSFVLSVIYAAIELRFYENSEAIFLSFEASLQLLIIMAVLVMYARIYKVVLSQRKRIVTIGGSSVRQQARISSRERSRTHTVTIILTAFIACYTPYTVHIVISIHKYSANSDGNPTLVLWSGYLVLLNSCLNPIIYCARSQEIRHAAVRIFMPWLIHGRALGDANAEENRGRRFEQYVATSRV